MAQEYLMQRVFIQGLCFTVKPSDRKRKLEKKLLTSKDVHFSAHVYLWFGTLCYNLYAKEILGSHAILQWVIHFQNLIVHVEIHILHKEHLREEARESCLAEDRRGLEDGLLTEH